MHLKLTIILKQMCFVSEHMTTGQAVINMQHYLTVIQKFAFSLQQKEFKPTMFFSIEQNVYQNLYRMCNEPETKTNEM